MTPTAADQETSAVSGRAPRLSFKPIDDPRTTAVIFLHLAKTAGTTFNTVLRWNYPLRSTHHMPQPIKDSVAAFKAMPEPERGEIRLLQGHFGYGLHEWLPGPSTYITFMRDPIDRLISLYFYFKRDHYGQSSGIADLSLLEFATTDDPRVENENYQVRRIAGIDDAPGRCPAEMLDVARRHLHERFAVVGLTDRFDETILLMRRALKWKRWPYYIRSNIGSNRPPRSEIDREVLKAIERNHELDLELYEYVRKGFDETVRACADWLQPDLERFNRRNAAMARFLPAPLWIWRQGRRLMERSSA